VRADAIFSVRMFADDELERARRQVKLDGRSGPTNVMEVASIPAVIERVFGGESFLRGRLFLCCVTGGEVMVMTDGRGDGRGGVPIYHNVLGPTVCGRCDKDGQGTRKAGWGMKLSAGLMEDWRVYKMVKAWCGREVETVVEVAERGEVIREVRGYWVEMQGSRMTMDGGLEAVTYVDPGFL
jgi:hypothetical protein